MINQVIGCAAKAETHWGRRFKDMARDCESLSVAKYQADGKHRWRGREENSKYYGKVLKEAWKMISVVKSMCVIATNDK